MCVPLETARVARTVSHGDTHGAVPFLIIQDAIALGTRDFEKDLDIFDRMLLAALAMGDYQAEGILQYLTVTRRDLV